MQRPTEFTPGQLIPEDQARQWLRSCGAGIRIYRGCRLFPPERIAIGDHSQIDEGVWIFAGTGVEIGRHVHLAAGCSIAGGGACILRDFAGLGAGVRLVTGSEQIDGQGLTNPTIPAGLRAVRRGRIEIGAHALVFTGGVVLPDVTIGEGAVVAAGALVHHDLKPWAIYAGSPLVQVGVRDPEPIRRLERELARSTASA
jgi:galactoside O-acetyltransferase